MGLGIGGGICFCFKNKNLMLVVVGFRSWRRYFVAAASGSMLQGQPVWCVSPGDELSLVMVQQLFSQSAADIIAVAFWDNNVSCTAEKFTYVSCNI